MVGFDRLVEVRLGDDLPGGVHGEDRHAAVDDVYAVKGADVGDGAAALVRTSDGYARQKTVLFSRYRMLDKGRDLPLNAALRVLDELPGRYVVEVGGAIGYLPRDLVSRTPIAVGGNGGAEWTDPML